MMLPVCGAPVLGKKADWASQANRKAAWAVVCAVENTKDVAKNVGKFP